MRSCPLFAVANAEGVVMLKSRTLQFSLAAAAMMAALPACGATVGHVEFATRP
jgi:hypothetical protein